MFSGKGPKFGHRLNYQNFTLLDNMRDPYQKYNWRKKTETVYVVKCGLILDKTSGVRQSLSFVFKDAGG